MKTPYSVILAAVVCAVTLLTYLLEFILPPLAALRQILVHWAVIVASFALIVGFINLLAFHTASIFRRRSIFYSFVLIASMLLPVPLAYIADVILGGKQGLTLQAVPGFWMTKLYQYILVPIQASVAALLPFVLAFAAYRTLRVRSTEHKTGSTWGGLVFLISAILVLLGQVALFGLLKLSGIDSALVNLRALIMQWPVTPGMRGILLGVALGVTATALRVLIARERPSGD